MLDFLSACKSWGDTDQIGRFFSWPSSWSVFRNTDSERLLWKGLNPDAPIPGTGAALA